MEIIENLQYRGYKIIQEEEGFKFGVDAVLAAYYSEHLIKKGDKVLDLGTGTGIIAILVAARTLAEKIIGIEVQEKVADMAKRSVKLNNLEERVEIVVDNIANPAFMKKGFFNHVITNPPYKKTGTGIVNPSDSKAVSRHEVLCNLEDVISLASKSLVDGGCFTMVNRPERLCDIMELMRKYKIEPKNLRMVYPALDKAPSMVLINGIKGGKAFLKTEKPLFIFDESGDYSSEINEIYNRG